MYSGLIILVDNHRTWKLHPQLHLIKQLSKPHKILQAFAKALYSESVLETDTDCCLQLFQLINPAPSLTIYPIVDFLSTVSAAQSESQ